MLLEVNGLCVNYGRIEAIRDISFTVDEGEIVTLIGANGAGKTTTMKTVSGLRPVRAGSIVFNGKDITHTPSHERPVLGISQSPEGRGCFVGMSVMENLEMGTYARPDRKTKAVKDDLDRVFELFPRLKERSNQAAGSMSGGEQQMLALARAYVQHPRFVLLDEVSMGLAPKIVDEIFAFLELLAASGASLLLVEQYVSRALDVADYVYLLNRGEVVFLGEPGELDADALAEQYVGSGH